MKHSFGKANKAVLTIATALILGQNAEARKIKTVQAPVQKTAEERIDSLKHVLESTYDIQTCDVPDSLAETQLNYNKLLTYCDNRMERLTAFMTANEKMFHEAYNDYAARIGKDFNLGNYFVNNDLLGIRNMLRSAHIVDTDIIKYGALQRIRKGNGSLRDLELMAEYLDYKYIEKHFYTKIYKNSAKSKYGEFTPSIVFSDENANIDQVAELSLLSNAWAANYVKHLISNVSSPIASAKIIATFARENGGIDVPNFTIPEMAFIQKAYLKNEEFINFMYNVGTSIQKKHNTLIDYAEKHQSDVINQMSNVFQNTK